MVRLKPIELSDIKRYVCIAFQGDDELINKYHQVNGDLTICVDSTVEHIQYHSRHYVLRYYAIFYNSVPVGFTVISIVSHLLYSFGINIKHRTKENVLMWFGLVKNLLTNGITCVLWSKNSRAINFLVKNGLMIESTDNELTVLKSVSCQR